MVLTVRPEQPAHKDPMVKTVYWEQPVLTESLEFPAKQAQLDKRAPLDPKGLMGLTVQLAQLAKQVPQDPKGLQVQLAQPAIKAVKAQLV
jgi:hypothetical protein